MDTQKEGGLSALSVPKWLIISVFLVVAMMVTHPQTYDPDLYWHIRGGQVMLETGSIIPGDVFSYTVAGQLRVHPDWLGEIILTVFYDTLGVYGLTLLGGILSFASIVLMYRLMGGTFGVRAILMALAATATMAGAMARPQGWMVLLSLIVIGMVLRRKPRLYWLPVLMLFWNNLHGGWTIGYIILGLAVITEAARILFKRGGDKSWLRQLVMWSVIAAPFLMVNPYGYKILLVPLETVTQSALPYIEEWRAPNLLGPDRFGFIILVVLSLNCIVRLRGKMSLLEIALLVGFGLWGFRTARIITVYMFIAPVILAPYLSVMIQGALKRPFQLKPIHWILIGAVAFAVTFRFVSENTPDAVKTLTAQKMPVHAVNYLLENQLPQPIFNEYNWGGYLILYAQDYPVFMDGRGDLYLEFFEVYFEVVNVRPTWETILDEWDVQTLLIYTDGLLAQALEGNPIWARTYQDSLASIYVRQSPE